MYKKLFNALIFLFISGYSCLAQLTCSVDERSELISIVFRLADAEEYVNNQVFNYVADIDTYFAPYKEHELIQFAKEIRERDFIAYNAVSGITNLIEITNNKVVIDSMQDFNYYYTRDPRWSEKTLRQFVELLNVFYKDTDFKKFYTQHQALYQETEKRFNELLSSIHTDWFESFFGKPLDNPVIRISLTNGNSNYGGLGGKIKGKDSTNGIIIGCTNVDKDGIPMFISGFDLEGNPLFDSNLLFTIMHEFSHYFTNQLLVKYQPDMMPAAEKMFPYVKDQLAAVAYGDAGAILGEGLNNLFTNMYFKEHPAGLEPYNIRRNEVSGFVWMRRAMRMMESFSNNRETYPTIDAFMPQITSFINTSGEQIEQIMDEYNYSFPYVVNVFPDANTAVSSDIKEIRIDFSHPMWYSHGLYNLEGFTLLPTSAMPYWSEDRKTYIIPVNLEKGKTYGTTLLLGIFQSEYTFPMKENFEFKFQTK